MPGNLPVLQTLWTVAGPADYAAGELEGGEAKPAWFGELQRLKSAAAMLQLSAALGDEDAPKAPAWYRLWARRLLRRGGDSNARCFPRRARARHAPRTPRSRRSNTSSGSLPSGSARRDTIAQVVAEADVADNLDELARCGICPGRGVARYGFAEGVGSITLECRPA